MKAWLKLYTDAYGTLIFDKYEECSPKNYERTRRTEVGDHCLQHQTTDVTAMLRSHHNTVLCPKTASEEHRQCHQGALWRYGFLSDCSYTTGCSKLASRLKFVY